MPLTVERRAERASWLQLVLTPGLGAAKIHALLREFGLPEEVLSASAAQLLRSLPQSLVAALRHSAHRNEAAVPANLHWADAPGHHLIALGDDDYPCELLVLADPPPLLWVMGRPALLSRRSIAIVGSRHASRSGCDHAQAFARALGNAGWAVVSGLAQGIDSAAHRGGLLSSSSTIAIAANGLDRVYPAVNRELAHQIAGSGVIASEFAIGTPPLRDHFPRRNRLIAALSLGTLVVQAARQSGSLITARLAAEAGRDVFAIPGSIDSPLSKGCHALINQGARLVESAEDVLGELKRFQAHGGANDALFAQPDATSSSADEDALTCAPIPAGAAAPGGLATANQRALLECAGWDLVSIDQLAERTGASAAQLTSDLLLLELDGRIERLPDGRFQQLARVA